MNRSELEEYHDIAVRIHVLKTTVVTDSVKASSPEYPYTAHSVTLHGVCCDRKALSEIQQLESKKARLDELIDSISDERTKTLLDMHYRKNHSWARVAVETGRSVDCNEKYLQRYFKCP